MVWRGREVSGGEDRNGRDGNVNGMRVKWRPFESWQEFRGFLLILAACVARDGYLIGRDDGVRAKSNRAVAQFLTRAFAR